MGSRFIKSVIILLLCLTIDMLLLCTLLRVMKNGGQKSILSVSELIERPLPGELPLLAALTFDDGPDSENTRLLLDELLERNVKATFFVIGKNIPGNEELIKRMHEEGHIIGNHTYHHVMLSNYNLEDALKEIDETNQLIYEITGAMPQYIRPPFGAGSLDLEEMIDMTTVMWDIDPRDWQTKNKDKIVRHVVKNAEDNKIILLHDVHKASVEAALEIIDQMEAEGWKFVTIEDLMPN